MRIFQQGQLLSYLQSLVMVVNRNGKNALGFLLSIYINLQGFDNGGWSGSGSHFLVALRCNLVDPPSFFTKDRITNIHTFVANIDPGRAGNQ